MGTKRDQSFVFLVPFFVSKRFATLRPNRVSSTPNFAHLTPLDDGRCRLQKALDRHKKLTVDDLVPGRTQHFIMSALGEFASAAWSLYEDLGNRTREAEIDEAITHLRTAVQELSDRLQAVAA